MRINVPLVAGLASGFATANLLLAFTWYLCRRSNNRRAKRHQRDAEQASRRLEKSASFSKQSCGDAQPAVEVDTGMTHSEKRDPYTPTPTPANKRRQEKKVGGFAKPPPGLSGLRNQLTVPSIISRGTSGASFCDTASMYSTASAPIDLHDQILLSQPLQRAEQRANDMPYTPTRQARYTHPYAAPELLISPVHPSHSSSSPTGQVFGDELLAPEMYDKTLPYQHSGLSPQERLPPFSFRPGDRRQSQIPNQRRMSYIPARQSGSALPFHLKPALAQPSPLTNKKPSPPGRRQSQISSWLPSPHSPPPFP